MLKIAQFRPCCNVNRCHVDNGKQLQPAMKGKQRLHRRHGQSLRKEHTKKIFFKNPEYIHPFRSSGQKQNVGEHGRYYHSITIRNECLKGTSSQSKSLIGSGKQTDCNFQFRFGNDEGKMSMRRHNLNLINRVKGENKSVRDRIGPIPSVKGITREIILASFSCPLIYIIPLYFITQLPPLSPSKLVYPPPFYPNQM